MLINKISEARNSISDANEIFMVVNHREELLKLNKRIKLLDGYEWPTGLDDTRYMERQHEYPIYVFFNLETKQVTYAPRNDMTQYIDNISKEYRFNGVLNKIFRISDIEYFVHMLKLGKIIPNVPNYNPKKFIRENKEFKEYQYRDIVIKVDNEDELEELQDKIKTITRLDNNLGNTINTYPNYIFIDVNHSYNNRNVHIYYMSDRIDDDAMNRYLYYDDKVNQHIFNLSEWKKIEHILLYGSNPLIPNYNPKKFDRTLEARNSMIEAEEITILIRNIDEYNIFHDAITSIGYKIDDSFYQSIKSLNSPTNIFINLKTGIISQASGIHEYYKHWTDYCSFDGVWEKELTIEDLPYMINILKMGKIIPSYEPRKIIRKLDESVDLPSYMPKIPPILTPEEQRKIYKIDDIVIVRPDAFDYFRDVDSYSMPKYLRKKVEIVSIKTGEEHYGSDYGEDEVIEYKVKPDDLLITVKSVDESLPDDGERWYWLYRCLFTPKTLKPSYEPKKFDRTLEKLNEEYDTKLSDDLKNCSFFKKYDSFIVTSDENDDKTKFNNVKRLLERVFKLHGPRDPDETSRGYYIAYRIQGILLTSGWGYLEGLDNFNRDHNHVCKKFTVDQVDTEEKIHNILKYGLIVPSYAPKKFDRTLENINESPDWAAFIDKDGERELLRWDLPKSYAFGYYKDKMYISPETKGHGSMGPEDERKTKIFSRNDFKFPGRIWTHQKLISFWIYPDKKELDKILVDLSILINVHFDDPEWGIEILDEHMVYQNVSISEYTGSKEVPYEDLSKQHVVSPLLKPRREVPYGFGSKNPSYQPKRAWDMASLTSESASNIKIEDKIGQLIKGDYECICFNLEPEEQEEAWNFFNDLEIISEINRTKTNYHFVILTKKASSLDPFILYTYNSIPDIRKHMSENFYIPLDKISPVFTFSRFKGYINRTLAKPAKDMYAPKKMDRTLENLNESLDKDRGLAIFCENRQQYERVKNDFIEWGYMDSDGEYYKDFDLDNPLTYPIMIMINTGDFDVFFTYSHDPFEELDDEVMDVFKQYSSPNDFYAERDTVQFFKNKGVMIPNYAPRKIDRFI